MGNYLKNQSDILAKLQIEQLNPMQVEATKAIHANAQVVLLSPTGTGKTLAFTLPIIDTLDPSLQEVQAVIVVPSRELAIQIEQVLREMGTGFKINAVYGGSLFSKDRNNLKHPPAILVGTPGRLADHLRRATFSIEYVRTLIMDEYDKSIEVGFEKEILEISQGLPLITKTILTSATKDVEYPRFLNIDDPVYVDYLDEAIQKLKIRIVQSESKDKLEVLVKTLCHIGNQPGIIFCNFKESINRVSDYLSEKGITHGRFYGGMEQQDRERALIKFRNGTHQILLATDLAARGLDIPEIGFIIHYHLPLRSQEFTHRNGRTARMHKEGTAYVLSWTEEELPDFIEGTEVLTLDEAPLPTPTKWDTVFISGGRTDKISKGDIAGLFLKKGELDRSDLGEIELKQDCSFVAVAKDKSKQVVQALDNSRIKKRKVRIYSL